MRCAALNNSIHYYREIIDRHNSNQSEVKTKPTLTKKAISSQCDRLTELQWASISGFVAHLPHNASGSVKRGRNR